LRGLWYVVVFLSVCVCGGGGWGSHYMHRCHGAVVVGGFYVATAFFAVV
jgi:hypothetical protein